MKASKKSQNTLKKQLVAVIFSVVTFVMFLSGILFISASYYFLNNRLEIEADHIAKLAAKQISTAIIFDQEDNVNELLNELKKRPEITQAKVYLADNEEPLQGISCKTASFISLKVNKCATVKDGDVTIATVQLIFTRQYLIEQQITQLFILLGSLIVSLMVSFIFTEKMSKKLTQPLSNLVESMQAVAKNNSYDEYTEVSGTEEIKVLSESFNQMLSELQIKDKAISEYTTNLEQLIDERTESLQKAVEDAERANASKSEFLSNMSHELRTPLHGILSFARLGIKRHSKAEREKLFIYFERICTSGERLLVLLNDLLDLSKLEAGKMELDKKTNCLFRLTETCVAESGASLKEKKLDLIWHKKDCDTFAFFDNTRVSQVITNLLSNAIKFTPENRSIEIAFTEIDYLNQPALQFTINDQGVGIPKDELGLVFDKFSQSSKTKTNAGGTGLGLAICKEIVTLHGGKIWAEAVLGQGASFSFILPVQDMTIENENENTA